MNAAVWAATTQMSVLYIEKTGHVLGAATLVGGGAASTDPKALAKSLAGNAMPVANGPSLSPEQLTTAQVAYSAGALREPTKYALQDKTLVVPPVVIPAGNVLIVTSPPPKNQLTITLPANITKDTDVLVRIEGDTMSAPFELPLTVKPQNPPVPTFVVVVGETLVAGDYQVLVAVAGYALYNETKTVP